jgi:prepilin-type N-terminal cleavage/methylation domain-containing protein
MKINKNKTGFYFAKNGFTLIEILVVIAIIVIVIGAGIGTLSNRRNYEYKAEVDKIYKLITDAQANATKSSPVITINNPSVNPTLDNISFMLPNIPNNTPNNPNCIALFKINKILNNNGNINDSLSLEYSEDINRQLGIDNSAPDDNPQNAMINNNSPFNLPAFYNAMRLFYAAENQVYNYPISYMVLIRNNNNQLLPIVFRTNGSLANSTQELYVRISHFPNDRRFGTYYIGIRGNNIRKYVR